MGQIERGKIQTASGGAYTVESLDRKGIISPPLSLMIAETLNVGDMVLFVLFGDGTGKIICKA